MALETLGQEAGGRASGNVPGTLRMASVSVGSASHSNILTEMDRRAERGCGSGEKEEI